MIRRMITTVEADEIAGAGGRPALRVQIGLACGIRESAVICPSGKRQGESGGAYLKRCHELVQEAVKATETLVREYLTGSPAQEQEALEARLKPLLSECTDETGAALRFAVSAAAAKAAAHAFSVPLYRYLGGVCAAAPVPAPAPAQSGLYLRPLPPRAPPAARRGPYRTGGGRPAGGRSLSHSSRQAPDYGLP